MKKLLLSMVACGAFALLPLSATAAQIYLVGQPSENNWNINSDAMALDEISEGVYYNTFNIAAGEFKFRFYSELGDWENNSIGSQVDDASIDINNNFSDGIYEGQAIAGKGSWQVVNWPGGDVAMTVDTNNHTVKFETSVEVPELTMPDALYLVGDLDGANWDPSNKTWAIPKTGDGIYSGQITGVAPASGTTLNFKLTGGDWGFYEIGSKSGDSFILFNDFPYKNSNINTNKENFNIQDWDSSKTLEITVNLKNNTIQMLCPEGPSLDKVYLIGIGNMWDFEGLNDYALEKLDGWKFQGTFTVPEDLNFLVLSAPAWGNKYGGPNFSINDGLLTKLNLEYQASTNLYCTNWDSEGELQFTVDLENLTIEIVDPNTLPKYPENLYLVGNMNGWDIADKSLAFTPKGDGVYSYTGNFDLLGGELNFKIVNNATDWESEEMIQFGGYNFALYSDKTYTGDLTTGGDNLYCYNWLGGEIEMTVNLADMTISIIAPDQLEEEAAPKALFLTGIMNEWSLTDRSFELELQEDGTYTGTFELEAEYTTSYTAAPEFKIFYEANWNSVLGADGTQTVMVDFTDSNVVSAEMVTGGQNWQLENWEGGEVKFNVNWETKNLTLEYLTEKEPEEFTTVNIVVGEGEDAEIIPMGLEIGSKTQYYGVLNSDADLSTFNIQVITQDGEKFYGPGDEVIITDDSAELSGTLVEGDSIWTLDWQGGIIGINIDLEDLSYNFDISSTAVNSLINSRDSEIIYNIHGVRVDRNNLMPGIYIINGKKVVVK